MKTCRKLGEVLLGAVVAAGALAGAALACEVAATAEPVSVRSIDARGDILLDDGRLVRPAGLLWPAATAVAARGRLTAELSAMLLHEAVVLSRTGQADRWGRIGGQLHVLSAARAPFWVQGQIVEDGLAVAWAEPVAGRCWADLVEREQLARDGGLGVWSALGQRGRTRVLRAREAGGPQRVVFEGVVRSVRPGRSVTFINFRGSRDVTPTLFAARRLVADMARSGRDVTTLAGKRLRLRAELSYQPQPRLTVASAEAIELLD